MRRLLLPGLALLWSVTCVARPIYPAEFAAAADLSAAETGSVATAFTALSPTQVNVFDDTSSGHVARRSLPRPPAGPKCYACVPS
jgi:hypothetical protein